MRSTTILLLAFALGCSRSSSSSGASSSGVAPAESASVTPSAAKGSAPEPAALPFCKQDPKAEPLAALCRLGADATKTFFECKAPRPVMLCKNVDDWGCQYMGVLGEKPPTVTFHATFDHHGPPVKDGESFGPGEIEKKFPKIGPTRKVAVQFDATDDDDGARIEAAEVAKLKAVGCVLLPAEPYARANDDRLDCGSFAAHLHYLDINKTVYVEVAMPGDFECKN